MVLPSPLLQQIYTNSILSSFYDENILRNPSRKLPSVAISGIVAAARQHDFSTVQLSAVSQIKDVVIRALDPQRPKSLWLVVPGRQVSESPEASRVWWCSHNSA